MVEGRRRKDSAADSCHEKCYIKTSNICVTNPPTSDSPYGDSPCLGRLTVSNRRNEQRWPIVFKRLTPALELPIVFVGRGCGHLSACKSTTNTANITGVTGPTSIGRERLPAPYLHTTPVTLSRSVPPLQHTLSRVPRAFGAPQTPSTTRPTASGRLLRSAPLCFHLPPLRRRRLSDSRRRR